jgi:hypothetical protein
MKHIYPNWRRRSRIIIIIITIACEPEIMGLWVGNQTKQKEKKEEKRVQDQVRERERERERGERV